MEITGPSGSLLDGNQHIADSYDRLVGLRIGPGFTMTVKRLFRGVEGCSHMIELLPPMATTAFQILWSRPNAYGASAEGQTPLGGCHALRLDGPLVARRSPILHVRRSTRRRHEGLYRLRAS